MISGESNQSRRWPRLNMIWKAKSAMARLRYPNTLMRESVRRALSGTNMAMNSSAMSPMGTLTKYPQRQLLISVT